MIGWRRIGKSVWWWLMPIAFMFWLYNHGLRVWFIDDDFAWLGLRRGVGNFHDLVHALFDPQAQGTIRPWSDRGFFLLFESLFGLDSLPFRICVFVTMAANVALLAWIVRRITRSALAGILAPVFWISNAALIAVMSWNSAFDEALCALFLLLATALFIRWDESGERKYWWWQLVVFVLGFGALEINVVYPALAAAYALFVAIPERRRRLLVSLTPLFGVSVIYFLLHRMAAPLPSGGPYALHLDGRIFQTFGTYWHWSLIPKVWLDAHHSVVREQALFWIVTSGLAYFLVREIFRSRHIVLFFVFWFLICLGPLIPLPEHLMDYYLTIPLIGLSAMAACGVANLLEKNARRYWILLLALVILWMLPMIASARAGVDWWVSNSRQVRTLVLGVAAAEQAHPGKTIVLQGVSGALYNNAVGQSALYAAGFDNVYLAPGSAATIHPDENLAPLNKLVLGNAIMAHALIREDAVVYSVLGDHLKNITAEWGPKAVAHISDPAPHRIEAGNPLFAYLVGPQWYPLEAGIRWMPQRASVRLGGPKSARDRLILEGFCPQPQLKHMVLHLSVTVDGIELKNTEIDNPETSFERLFDMPPSLLGKPEVEVAISVDRVFQDPGGRMLGLAFGTIAIE
jgi:hypothetical protein